MRAIDRLFNNISRMTEEDDLAAVLIHFNDTYLLEPRGNHLPGMAHIATLIYNIRESVMKACGEDRTLSLHSGDFIMPSRLGKITKGESMTRMFAQCVNILTLGNHEFDLGKDVLKARIKDLQDAKVQIVCSNVDFKSAGIDGIKDVHFWPSEQNPLFAITGIMSKPVVSKALKWGAKFTALETTLEECFEAKKFGSARRLVVLSHADQVEDLSTLKYLDDNDRGPKFSYLLGGHDHDISWSQLNQRGFAGNSVFSKCLSNCCSLRVFLISRSRAVRRWN